MERIGFKLLRPFFLKTNKQTKKPSSNDLNALETSLFRYLVIRKPAFSPTPMHHAYHQQTDVCL